MKSFQRLCIAFAVLFASAVAFCSCNKADSQSPGWVQDLAVSPIGYRDSVPSKHQYAKPLFRLSCHYPAQPGSGNDKFRSEALNGRVLSAKNAWKYMDALKQEIKPLLQPFFTDSANWAAEDNGWFHESWLGTRREPLLGAYLEEEPASPTGRIQAWTGFRYVLTLYDSTAAFALGKSQNAVGYAPRQTDFAEGSTVVKLIFSPVNDPVREVMHGAATFLVYDTLQTLDQPEKGYRLRTVSFFRMDIAVKDSKAAPGLGWVYASFVYDTGATGSLWDKLVPLAMVWNKDPEALSPLQPPFPSRKEKVVNTAAPVYAHELLYAPHLDTDLPFFPVMTWPFGVE